MERVTASADAWDVSAKRYSPDPVFTTTLSASVSMILTSFDRLTGRPRLVSPTAVLAGLIPVAVALGGAVMKISRKASLIFQPLTAFSQQVPVSRKRYAAWKMACMRAAWVGRQVISPCERLLSRAPSRAHCPVLHP